LTKFSLLILFTGSLWSFA